MEKAFVRILGSRGSVPIENSKCSIHGGMTSCIYVSLGNEAIIFDAGSGILNVSSSNLKVHHDRVSILLSHTHIDHIIGLPLSSLMCEGDMIVDIYGANREGMDVKDQLKCLMSPPLWPVTVDHYNKHINFHDASKAFFIGDVKVTTMEGNHPGGCTLFRLDYNNKSVVYATDNELTDNNCEEFIKFAKGCSLLFIDGQYSAEEAPKRKGYGHSDWQTATEVAVACDCESFYLFHHDPERDDETLLRLQERLKTIAPNGFVAKKRVEIWL